MMRAVKACCRVGFEVTVETNRDLKRMRRALDDFREDGAGRMWPCCFTQATGLRSPG